ncbi:hypothetical protein JI739_07975 [Ramlibacter sp. AW1]|uniref:Uncharacterized protein n=1 Tax=Ramlibacter aurantiacus TaxID=2801330 RepID=A0A937D5U4_9BURK|nr:hypothetical protein [Ramlibacter aurantiacus]MBL0420278.1 hypothetical protein [Ramlibacter aurantiacus]
MGSTQARGLGLHGQAWQVLGWAGVGAIASLLVLTLARQQWAMTVSLAVFLAASWGIVGLLSRLPSFLRFLLVLVALLNGAGGTFDWFETHAWFDELVHTYGGFAGLAAIGYLHARDSEAKQDWLVAWCVGMGLALGIGWEVLEGLMGDLEFVDTLTDIIADTVGAALGGAFARHALRAGQAGPRPFLRA